MITDNVKAEIDTQVQKLATLRDEIKVRLHLATLDAKKEWDEKLAPKLVEVEGTAKNFSDSSRGVLNDVITKAEEFLARLKTTNEDTTKTPPSVN